MENKKNLKKLRKKLRLPNQIPLIRQEFLSHTPELRTPTALTLRISRPGNSQEINTPSYEGKNTPKLLEFPQYSEENRRNPFHNRPNTVIEAPINQKKLTVNELVKSQNKNEKTGLPRYKSEEMKKIKLAKEKNLSLFKNRERAIKECKSFEYVKELFMAFKFFSKQLEEENWFIEDGRLTAIEQFLKLESLSLNTLSKLCTELDSKNNFVEDLKSENEKLKLEIRSLKKRLDENTEVKNKQKTGEKRKVNLNFQIEQEERMWSLEREKLKETIEILSERLKNVEPITDAKELENELSFYKYELKQTNNRFQEIFQKKNAIIYKLEHKLSVQKQEFDQCTFFVDTFEQVKSELEQNTSELYQEISELKEKLKERDERLYMALEDMSRLFVFKEMLEITKEQLILFKNKYTQLEINTKIGNFSTKGEGGFVVVNSNDPLFEKIYKSFPYQINTTVQNSFNGSLPSGAFSERSDLSSIDLTGFRFLRPSFAELLNFRDTNYTYETKFSNFLELVVRGLFDSKFYEILSCTEDTGKTPSRFPEFVYSWFDYYEIDPAEKKVTTLPVWKREQSGQTRREFFIMLVHEKIKQIWEIQTFHDFLTEELNIDELAFYLHCRYLLFRGPQLETSSGRHSIIQFIDINQVYRVIDLVMNKLLARDRNELKEMIFQNSVAKSDYLSIDSAFALRLCLEYYKNEKKAKFLCIQKLFNMNAKAEGISFEGFKIMCENLDNRVISLEIATIYRDTWALSQGEITPESFFLEANESCFFYRQLRLKKFWDSPVLDSKGEISTVSGVYSLYMRKIYEHFLGIRHAISMCKSAVECIGVPTLLVSLERLEDFLKKKGQVSIEENYGWSLLWAYRHLWHLVDEIGLVYEEYNSETIEMEEKARFKHEVEKLPTNEHSLIKKMHMQNIKKFIENKAVRHIERIWKQKSINNLEALSKALTESSKIKEIIINR